MTTVVRASESELEDLRSMLRGYLAERLSEENLREAIGRDPGYDVSVWRDLADQLGLVSLPIPTEFGGDGYSFVEMRVVLEEMGRVLLPGPYLSTVVLGVSALLVSADADIQSRYLPEIAAGTTTATFAVAEDSGKWDAESLDTAARSTDGGWVLRGRKPFVLDGMTADLVLVVASTESGPTLFAVEGDAPGLRRTEMTTLDLTRRLAQLDFDDVPAIVVGRLGEGRRVVDYVTDRFMVALAAEQLGAAKACLEASSAYARERVQFGRPIGSFQAIKHKCADMFVKVRLAEAAVSEAADALAGVPDAPDPAVASALAHVVCSESLMFVSAENIQVHGGIGFTWEHPAHLFFRRAKSSQLLLGGPAFYYDQLLMRMGIAAAQ